MLVQLHKSINRQKSFGTLKTNPEIINFEIIYQRLSDEG